MTKKLATSIPRIALTSPEAAAALGVGPDFFDANVAPELRLVRRGRKRHLRRSGRSGEDLVFGRTTVEAFYAATVDGRAKRAGRKANERERAAAQEAGREPVLLDPITLHHCRHTFASLLIDSGANPKAIQEFMATRKFRRPSMFTDTCSQAAATRFAVAWIATSVITASPRNRPDRRLTVARPVFRSDAGQALCWRFWGCYMGEL